MKNNNKIGDDNSKHCYTPYEIFYMIYTNYYWKFFDYFACNLDKYAKIYEEDISEEYKKESNLFKTIKSKNIIHIGCGAYPATAITLAKMNCKNIVAIDKNKRAIKLANKIIARKNLNKKITVKVGDGRTYPVEKFDTIIISASSSPKLEVLDHIVKTAKPNSKIIIRELFETSDCVDDYINKQKNIKLIKKIENNSLDEYKWKSYYTVKLQ